MTKAPYPGANIGDLAFGQLLAAQLQKSGVAAPLQNLTNDLAQARQLGAQLKTTILQLLQNGASLEQVVNQLAQSLGSDFFSKLQTQLGVNPGTNVQATVNQLLAQALGPPANGPPQTATEAAAALVERLIQVADTLARVSGNAAGQQQDSLGTISDANAGDNPAPNKTKAILQAALAALQTLAPPSSAGPSTPSSATANSNVNPASNAVSNPVQGNAASSPPTAPPAPWVPSTTTATTASSTTTTPSAAANPPPSSTALAQTLAQTSNGGPTVATNPVLTLVGTGGDTVIGRILARAANVAAEQGLTQTENPSANAPSQGTNGATALLQPQIAVTPASSTANGATADALLASVLRNLQTALASLPPPKTDAATADSAAADDATSSPSASTASAPTSAVFSSLGLGPLVSTTVGTATPSMPVQANVPTQTAYVDPNGIVDQVLRGISLRSLPDGTQSVRMRLIPESLGDVTVSLAVQNGSVNATLVAQNSDVRDTLLANQQTLMRSLADAGLKLSSFTVNLANNGQQYQQPQNPNQPQFGTTRRYIGTSPRIGEDAVSAIPTFGPPSTQLAALQWLNALA